MIATTESPPLDRWRQRFAYPRRNLRPRPLAALGYLVNGPVLEGLVEIDKLTIILLYDEPVASGPCALRLVGYSASPVPWGVRFGGADRCRFFKDLSLQPVPGARGYRLDLASAELLQLGLRLERDLDRYLRYRRRPREAIHLPKLWAGFRAHDAAGITGDGPELTAYAERTGMPPEELMARLRHSHFGLTLLPLSWVSHQWEKTVTVFADLARFPQRQVFRCDNLPEDLVGFQDAAEFDFYSAHFRGRRAPRYDGAGRRRPTMAAV